MATLITMPAIVADATSAVLSAWHKQPGDVLAAGEALADIDTEKATVEYEAEASGTIARLLVAPGDDVPVGSPIAVLAEANEAPAQIEAVLAEATVAGETAKSAAATEQTDPSEPAGTSLLPEAEARIFSSPLARRLAREHQIELSQLAGSGPNGRIVRSDVQAAIAAGATAVPAAPAEPQAPTVATAREAAQPELPANAQRIELTRMRKAIARRLTESKTTVPHFYLAQDVAVDELLALRRQLNESSPQRITVNDLILKAVAKALIDVPQANACWAGDSITQFGQADISVAIATETGLVTPVVRAAEAMAIGSLSATVADFVARAKSGQLGPAELAGGSFTVSNLGMYGTREFSAILNPPQAGILAVGTAEQRAVVRDGELAVATMMTCTLSADHRVMDGSTAALLLAAIKNHLESPLGLLI